MLCDLCGQLLSADLLDITDAIETFILATPYDGLIFVDDWQQDLKRHTAHCDTIQNFYRSLRCLYLQLKIRILYPWKSHVMASENFVRVVSADTTVGSEKKEPMEKSRHGL